MSIENGNTTKAASEQRTSRIPAKYQLTATVLGVGGLHSQLDSFSKPVLGTQHVDLVNRLGALQGAELRGQRGTAFRTASAFAGRTGSRLFEIQVERGTSTLLVQANATGASREDLELYLYDCSSGYCFMYEFDTPAAAEQSMIVRDPAPGKWKVIVSPGPTSTGRGGFEYLDVMTGPAYGRVTTQSPPTTKKVGEKWRQSFTIGPSTAPAGRREPVVLMEVIDEGAEKEVKQQSLGRPLKAGNVLKTRPISLWTQVYYLSDRFLAPPHSQL